MFCLLDEPADREAMSGHRPVLVDEALARMPLHPGARLLDATFGGGGHARALLEAGRETRVTALDRDPEAERRAAPLRDAHGDRFVFHRLNFGALDAIDDGPFDGALFDFGLSSFQLDETARGFSFREDAPADMRMDPAAGASAAEFLENADEASLIRAIRDYGEERRWRRVVAAILRARGTGQLQRTRSLAGLVASAVGGAPRGRRAVHPATRSFQGIRVAVNDELSEIERGLPLAFERLAPDGVLVAIAFHSLEDRLVKRFFRRVAGRPEHREDARPQSERVRRAEILTARPVRPGDAEIRDNPRARSACLRAVRKRPEPETSSSP